MEISLDRKSSDYLTVVYTLKNIYFEHLVPCVDMSVADSEHCLDYKSPLFYYKGGGGGGGELFSLREHFQEVVQIPSFSLLHSWRCDP